VDGNSALAHTLQQILADSRIDWEAWLGNLIGDTAAHPVAHLLRSAGTQVQQTGSSLLHSIEEYLHEEARLLPTRVEIEIAQDEIESLRAATDRLEARISRLERHASQSD
jgi:ubiquinone biosynthesis protein UbiJ